MKRVLVGLTFLACCASAQAEERISALDFGLSNKDYIGKPITVEGCQFAQATIDLVYCRIVVNKNAVGLFRIETKAIPRDTLKKMILECGGLEYTPECKGDVSGTPEDRYGDLYMTNAQVTLPN